ncbi:MAG TPA: 4-hydroxyphenylpyruvate dioxygenase [Mycobacteriales bacterium]|nr:4-hydroxyphenylpyruvate dioxygenase [Mycobacteriales bacterium]
MDTQRIDHVEFYAADADRAARVLCDGFGFRVAGALGPDARGQRSVLLRQGGIQLLVTAATAPDHPARQFVNAHGPGVGTVALATADPAGTLLEALDKGAVPLPAAEPTGWGDPLDAVRVRAFGSIGHRFVAPGALAARFAEPDATVAAPPEGDPLDLLDEVDHIAVCVPAGELATTVALYQDVYGFASIFTERIEVGTQAMNSEVVQSPTGTITLTILEPDPTRDRGQIDDFVAAHGGPGVQHLALRTDDIATSVRTLSRRGVGFLSAPGAYYEELARLPESTHVPLAVLRELDVLVDRDESGELFQIFSRSTHPRRTFFFELIERRLARTFGTSNISALYRAVELDRSRAQLSRVAHAAEPDPAPLSAG